MTVLTPIETTDTTAGMPVQLGPGMTGDERRAVIREGLKRIAKDMDRHRARLAELLAEVRDKGYWKEWGYRSFGAYVAAECSLSLRTAQELTGTFLRLQEHGVPVERIQRMEWSKAAVAARILNSENLTELLGDMERLSFRDLRAKVLGLQRAQRRRPGPAESSCPGPPPTAPLRASGTGSANWRLPKPPADRFWVGEDSWSQAAFALSSGNNVLLTGPSGCGKSELCYLAAAAAGRTLEAFNCGAMSEPRSTLIGNTHFDRHKGTWFAESRFVRTVRQEGACILLDEINRAGPDAFNILLPLLDTQGYVATDESEGAAIVRRAPGVTFFATANLGMEYTGTGSFDQALLDRFRAVIALDFPPRDEEMGLLLRRCPGLEEKAARRLVEVAVRQRELAHEGEFVGSVSTRALLAAAAQIAAGVPIEQAVKFCIVNRFSADGGDVSEQAKLMQIFQRIKV